MPRSKTVGTYKLGALLGKGSFGEVRKGLCTVTGEEFAVKCIDKESLALHEHGKDQLYREIAIMNNLRYQHVVELIDVLESSTHIYLVIELVEDGELSRLIKPNVGMPEDEARKIFQQLICAVNYLHRNGVAHRDLKPDNLLMTKDGTLKVSDFGLSNLQPTSEGKVLEKLKLQAVCGTPNFVAPEVLLKNGYNGFAADIWSCGVLLYNTLFGSLPFTAGTVSELLRRIIDGRFQVKGEASREAKDLLRKILVVDPNNRINLDGISSHPWFVVGFDHERLSLENLEYSVKLNGRSHESTIRTNGHSDIDTTKGRMEPVTPSTMEGGIAYRVPPTPV